MSAERPDSIPGRMRAVADYLDTSDALMRLLGEKVEWENEAMNERWREVCAGVGSHDDMQRDLRADADAVEALERMEADRAATQRAAITQAGRRGQ